MRLGPRLWLQNLRPRAVLDELVRQRLPIGPLARRVLASPVYDHFVDGAPGLRELAVLGHCLRLVRGEVEGAPRVDLVVLDAPASGHGLALLEAPLLVREVIQKGPIGKMTAEVAELVRDPERSRTVIVTQAEEMPVTEALELRQAMEAHLGRCPELLLVNGLFPAVAATDPPVATDSPTFGLDCLWRRRRALNDRELERLAVAWRGRILEIPLLPIERGSDLVDALLPWLEPELAGREGRE